MALTINTNLFSLNTQRNLRNAQDPLAIAMQRLSSGLRINSAKDDAAGLAIATRMQRQVTGLSVAMRNANDGISFAQTAEGAETEMVNSLQRIYELANQSASYNTSTDRSSMNQEVTQLISELNRVVAQTRFNGQQFLNQAFSANFQVGTEVNENINISTSNVSPTAYGVNASVIDFSNNATNQGAIASTVAAITLRSGGLSSSATLGGIGLGNQIVQSDVANNSTNVINRINQYTAQTNVTAFSFGNAFVSTATAVGSADIATSGTSFVNYNAGYLTINGIQIGSTTSLSTLAANLKANLITQINAVTSQTGVTAISLGTADTGAASAGSIALVNTSGAAITVSVATANAGLAGNSADFFGTTGGTVAAGQNGEIVFTAPLGTTNSSINTGTDGNAFGLSSLAATVTMNNARSINAIDVNTVGSANIAILAVKQGLETLNSEKAKLGAILNRFQSTLRNIDNVRENITAAKSRIMDADFASETANMTKAMITQQAGISVLAQANQIPQQVLALLGGR